MKSNLSLRHWLDSLSHRDTLLLAGSLSGVMTLFALLIPPSILSDPGWGFLAWRGFLETDRFNVTHSPDPTNIARDVDSFLVWWSPGQYLVPSLIARSGVRLGTALAVTSGLSLFACLSGWAFVARYFQLGSRTAVLAVLSIASFRYSTVPFGIYNGGEVLLQGVTPWIVLAGACVPMLSFFGAAGVAFLAVAVAFLAKLTGMVFAGAALTAGALIALLQSRRVTFGMLGGGLGAFAAFILIYFTFLRHGATPATGSGWNPSLQHTVYVLTTPWSSGLSWGDLMVRVFRFPGSEILKKWDLVWTYIPVALPMMVLVVGNARKPHHEARLARFALVAVAIMTATLWVLLARGGAISDLEERNLRSAGTLTFVAALSAVLNADRRRLRRYMLLSFTVLMGGYGIASYAHRAVIARGSPTLVDSFSRSRQVLVDVPALDFVRGLLAREQSSALVYLPSPDIAVALSLGARVVVTHLDFNSIDQVSALEFRGVVPGTVAIVMQKRIAESEKGQLLIESFSAYDPAAWRPHVFGETVVFTQRRDSDQPSPSTVHLRSHEAIQRPRL